MHLFVLVQLLKLSNGMKRSTDISGYGTLEIRNKSDELDRRKESRASGKDINHNEIRNRLEHLKLELSSVLQSLRSNVDEVLSQEVSK